MAAMPSSMIRCACPGSKDAITAALVPSGFAASTYETLLRARGLTVPLLTVTRSISGRHAAFSATGSAPPEGSSSTPEPAGRSAVVNIALSSWSWVGTRSSRRFGAVGEPVSSGCRADVLGALSTSPSGPEFSDPHAATVSRTAAAATSDSRERVVRDVRMAFVSPGKSVHGDPTLLGAPVRRGCCPAFAAPGGENTRSPSAIDPRRPCPSCPPCPPCPSRATRSPRSPSSNPHRVRRRRRERRARHSLQDRGQDPLRRLERVRCRVDQSERRVHGCPRVSVVRPRREGSQGHLDPDLHVCPLEPPNAVPIL